MKLSCKDRVCGPERLKKSKHPYSTATKQVTQIQKPNSTCDERITSENF